MNFNNQIYGTLLVSTLPRVIDSLEEYNRVEKIFESFLDKGENRSPEEDKLFDLLANLLEDYERRTLPPLPRSSPLGKDSGSSRLERQSPSACCRETILSIISL